MSGLAKNRRVFTPLCGPRSMKIVSPRGQWGTFRGVFGSRKKPAPGLRGPAWSKFQMIHRPLTFGRSYSIAIVLLSLLPTTLPTQGQQPPSEGILRTLNSNVLSDDAREQYVQKVSKRVHERIEAA